MSPWVDGHFYYFLTHFHFFHEISCPQQVEKASEFAVSEVFSHKKPQSGSNSVSVPLQSSDQLRVHDDAYSEGSST